MIEKFKIKITIYQNTYQVQEVSDTYLLSSEDLFRILFHARTSVWNALWKSADVSCVL